MKPELFLKGLDDRLSWLLEDFPSLESPQRAFTAWVLQSHGVSEDDWSDSIVDGPQDKGLDAIHVPEDGERLLVLQTKLTAKHDSNFSATSLVNTFNGVDWLLNGDLDEVDNPLFRSKAEEFREAFLATFPTVEVLFASTSEGPAEDGLAEIRKFEETYGQDFLVEVLDLQRLSEIFRSSLTTSTPNVVDLDLMDAPYERQVGDTRAIVGSVSGESVASLVAEFGTSIFEANIRSYLGSVKINRAIMDTATSDEAMNFLFYNNGLTFVCDELSFRSAREATHVRLKSAQIVNGCQTATALYEAAKQRKLREDTEVFIRIIQRPDPEFVGRVTLSTNSQNAVQAADLVGNDEIQRRLAEEFERLGYFYERRRRDFRAEYPTKEKAKAALGEDYQDRVIRLPEAAQAYAAFFLQIPVIAKRNPSYLFTAAGEKGRYEDVFGVETTATKLSLAVWLSREIRSRRQQVADYRSRLDLDLSWVPQADMFLLGLTYLRYFEPRGVSDDEGVMAFHEEARSNFEEWYGKLIAEVDVFIDERKKKSDYNPPKFFKSEKGYLELATSVAVVGAQGRLDI